jgi:addiction module RelE/StbE family toxin
MTTINFSSGFNSSLKKFARKRPELIPSVLQKIILFSNNLNHPSLGAHKLSGNMKDHWSFRVESDLRIIFKYTTDGNILFVDIGSHDQVY